MIHYPHNTEVNELEKKYSKGIYGIIERFCELILIILFVLSLTIVSLSFYWLIHWVIFGRNIYLDIYKLLDI